jgi:8-oxo-dGTP diphosphatase
MTSAQDMPRNPRPTVDAIIELGDDGDRRIVLIERKYPPHGWALPGGFIDYGESAADAAVREAKEETSLDVELVELFHVYSNPNRDPRLHTISVIYLARPIGPGAEAALRGADDAARAELFDPADLPPTCFDHGTILEDYRRYRATGRRPPPAR